MTMKPLVVIPHRDGHGIFDANHLGHFMGPAENEDGVPMPKGWEDAWVPGSNNFAKVPADVCMAFHRLCIAALDWCKHLDGEAAKRMGPLEVGMSLMRSWKTGEIIGVVEDQVISPGNIVSHSMHDERPPINIITGEVMRNWWEEWHEYGRFHSHNTMTAYPSANDNQSELRTPGVYAIYGQYKENKDAVDGWEFAVYPSIVTQDLDWAGKAKNIRRTKSAHMSQENGFELKRMLPAEIMEWDPESKATWNHAVVKNIHIEMPSEWEEMMAKHAAQWETKEPKKHTTESVKLYKGTPNINYKSLVEAVQTASREAGVELTNPMRQTIVETVTRIERIDRFSARGDLLAILDRVLLSRMNLTIMATDDLNDLMYPEDTASSDAYEAWLQENAND